MSMAPLVCRGRELHNLSAAQYALKEEGLIAEELRRRSPVYYWRHTEQTRSEYEAVCEKSTGWHAISFGSHGRFAELASWHCTRLQRTRDLDSCSNLSLASLPAAWVAANHIDVRTRGAGWWRWKPYTILQKLTSMREGEVLVHLDYDLVPTTDLRALFCIGQKVRKGVGAFHMPCHTDRAWTKRELAHEMRATDEMLDTVQIYAGLLVLRKNAFTLSFVREWLEWTTTGEWATDAYARAAQHAGFVEHRHDQSILSLLTKKHLVKSFPFPTTSHDVRDIWAWDAGYCNAGFSWPMPQYRPSYYRGYILHYKQMGHQYDSIRHCAREQRALAPLPLVDYLESETLWQHYQREEKLALRMRAAKGNLLTQLATEGPPLRVTLLLQQSDRPCEEDSSFGGVHFDGAPFVWVQRSCRGVFRCAGVAVLCGPSREPLLCACDSLLSVKGARHYRDGKPLHIESTIAS
uniref:Nucleotide-diphospho-sugar transferase domain-containing protein n=1 Tax=Chrysotila carterae TaxID=13221 RepID=A0A7S4B5A7_CHRCT|mmetsp:Transcript_33987/g.74574  ORF Transcript_33987/g.74574 Transcript_33987/m.74574 type:complete len:463 (+) Transcript_33987:517-1905(+)